jgi:hypothetical protein
MSISVTGLKAMMFLRHLTYRNPQSDQQKLLGVKLARISNPDAASWMTASMAFAPAVNTPISRLFWHNTARPVLAWRLPQPVG